MDSDIMRFIADYHAERRYPPTIREIATAMDVDEKTIRNRLRGLAETGEVTWRPGEHRTVMVTQPRRTGKARRTTM